MLYGPQIVLSNASGAITVHDERIEIKGTAKNVVEITLSGRPVFINDEGMFTERLLLTKGLNRFTFEAKDKFGHATQEILEVVYQPPAVDEASPIETDTIEEQSLE